MRTVFTRHAKRRMRERHIPGSRVSAGARKRARSMGGKIYRAEVAGPGGTTVVIYKVVNGKKVILSTWRKPRRRA